MASASDLGKREGWRVRVKARPQARTRWGRQMGLPPVLSPMLIHHAAYGPVSRAAGPLRSPRKPEDSMRDGRQSGFCRWALGRHISVMNLSPRAPVASPCRIICPACLLGRAGG